MCGRYSLTSPPEFLEHHFTYDPPRRGRTPVGIITPHSDALIIAAPKGDRVPARMKWGFPTVQSTCQNESIINARSETAAEKPTFKDAFTHRRCLVPANTFFERQRDGVTRSTYSIAQGDNQPFAMAGLWRRRRTMDGPVFEFVILTVPPNACVLPIHHRMPAILLPQDEAEWLDPDLHGGPRLQKLLQPYPLELVAEPVGNKS